MENNFVSKNEYLNETTNFLHNLLTSNSILAKLAFFVLILILYVLLLRLSISLMGMFFNKRSNNPRLFTGMVSGNIYRTFDTFIPKSDNQKDGLEFTWSSWIYVNDTTFNVNKKYHCIYFKGTVGSSNEDGMNTPNNAPGVYVSDKNELVIVMNTFNTINEQILIPNMPLNNWIHLLIRCEGKTLDIYVNGQIVKSHTLHGVPLQNNGSVNIGNNGGFQGYLSNLWYYSTALNISQIQNLVSAGPNTKLLDTNNLTTSIMNSPNTNYLAMRWYI